jgi:hypothetical protein
MESTELLVTALRAEEAFCEKGDSGALVVDTHCRGVGIIHGGNKAPGGPDFTYVTPIEWLLESIQETIGSKVYLPE